MALKHKSFTIIGLMFFVLGLVLYFFYQYRPIPPEDSNSPITRSVKVYFSNSVTNPNAQDCELVVGVYRNTQVSEDIAQSGPGSVEQGELLYLALAELLKGPEQTEIDNGFYTSIPSGVSIKGIDIRNGIVTVDFSEELDRGVAGSCRVTAIRSQIEKTIFQFDGIDSVVITVGNRRDDVLQP